MKNEITKILVGATLVVGCALSFTAFGQGNPNADRYIVVLKPGEQPAAVVAAHSLAPTHVYSKVLNGFAGQIPPGLLKKLADDPRVADIVVDHEVFAIGKPEGAGKPPKDPPTVDPQVVPEGVKRIGADPEAGLDVDGTGVGVAVLDTGLDFNHADLPVSKAWSYSAVSRKAQDDNGHGTHVGGIIAAKNNAQDVVGVAPGATLYAVKVLNRQGSGFDSQIIAGLDQVAAKAKTLNPKIKVVNMSLGRPATANDSAMQTAIQGVVAQEVTVVVAAGNDENADASQMVPAKFLEVVTVASTTAKDGESDYFDNGNKVVIRADTASFFTTDDGVENDADGHEVIAISAPGEDQEDIQLPYIYSVGILSTKLGGGTTRMQGTSMAAPHAAGVAALLYQKYSTISPADVKTAIMTKADRPGVAPLDCPTTTYTFDGEREGILYAPTVLGL